MNVGAQDWNGDVSGDGAGTWMETRVETRRRTLDGNGDESEDSSGDENRNEDRILQGGRKAKKRKKPQNSCRRHVENEGDLGGKKNKCRKERVGLVAANPDNLEN